jgi:hypothetical protein
LAANSGIILDFALNFNRDLCVGAHRRFVATRKRRQNRHYCDNAEA